MKKTLLRKHLERVEEDINILNIEYVGAELITDKEYNETIEILYKLKKFLLDELCK